MTGRSVGAAVCEGGLNDWAAAARDAVVTEALMSYSFELCRDQAGDYRARFRAPHGQILFTTDGRPDKVAILGVIDSLKRHAFEAEVDDLTAVDATPHRPAYAGH